MTNGPGGTVLAGTEAEKVTAAALAEIPDGTIVRVETDSSGEGVYEAHVRKADGSNVTLLFDADVNLTSTVDGFGGGGPGGPVVSARPVRPPRARPRPTPARARRLRPRSTADLDERERARAVARALVAGLAVADVGVLERFGIVRLGGLRAVTVARRRRPSSSGAGPAVTSGLVAEQLPGRGHDHDEHHRRR